MPSPAAHHGRELGIPITVCMPIHTPLVKQRRCELLGAKVLRCGEHILEARQTADALTAKDGLSYINGFDDPAVIAGQGTIGLEVLSQVPRLDAVVVPVGGGGLLAGIALAIKNQQPEVRMIGVERARRLGKRPNRPAHLFPATCKPPWPMAWRSPKWATTRFISFKSMLIRWCRWTKKPSPCRSSDWRKTPKRWWKGRVQRDWPLSWMTACPNCGANAWWCPLRREHRSRHAGTRHGLGPCARRTLGSIPRLHW